MELLNSRLSITEDENDDTLLAGQEVMVPVPHVYQQYSWDCGLACLRMILIALDKDESTLKSVCAEKNFSTSIWTIDLAELLADYNISFVYATVTLGVDSGYKDKGFYKQQFTKDECRVTEKFQSLRDLGLCIEKRSLTIQEILSHLAEHQPAIILIDWNKLNCVWCNGTPSLQCFNSVSCFASCLPGYQGHYIVLAGFNGKSQEIYYKNPSSRQDLCSCKLETFDEARKSYGTDEDIILIKESPQHRF